ncbi:TonB-dependent receptor family protein [Dokdonella sp.]|uniref:TonB-dependent receptor family protein n=1 Tax=Dokdonella sp. TaxID=2291710 RepID=UPI0039C87F9A
MSSRWWCCLFLCVFANTSAAGDESSDHPASAKILDPVVVSARLEQVPAFDTPASITTIDLEPERRPGVGVSGTLAGVPGLIARDRQNYAQDTQISVRGFGARATFGVRGIRLYTDGIPATMPDGQGQVSHFNLFGGGRIEILRGPFSSLYGNSSGGVIQLWSVEPSPEPEVVVQSSIGPDDSRTLGTRLRGTAGTMGYVVAAQRFLTDGYRDHSAAERTQVDTKLTFDLGSAGALNVIAGRLDAPEALDPLGLTWAQVQEDPAQATAAANIYNTRKSVVQNQAGLLYALPVGDTTLHASTWAGERRVEQFLALPVGAQANPLNSGGVIDLDNSYGGSDMRWSWHGALGGWPAELQVGMNYERQNQHRLGFENFAGTSLGVRGALRRNERNRVQNFDQYSQAWWQFAPDWSVLLGARHSNIRFTSTDRYVTQSNPDDSGQVSYAQTTPVAGLVYSANENLRYYLSLGRGFETPTFNELGYRADGGAGLAFDLLPAVSRNYELGGKWRVDAGAWFEWAVFRSDTENELAVATNSGGRSSYWNVGPSRRSGVELSFHAPVSKNWTLEAAYTGLDAHFRDALPTCSASGCANPETPAGAGTRIPGLARQQLQAAAQWSLDPWWATIEGLGVGNVSVNDSGDEQAPGYFLVNLAFGWSRLVGTQRLEAFVRLDNVLDRAYIGSVIVNERNRRFYEPGPGRVVLLGLRWQWNGHNSR